MRLMNSVLAVLSSYCTEAPNAEVSNSVVVGAYDTAIGDTSNVECVLGCYAGSSTTATCVALNATNGQWEGLVLTCTCTHSLCLFVDTLARNTTLDLIDYLKGLN